MNETGKIWPDDLQIGDYIKIEYPEIRTNFTNGKEHSIIVHKMKNALFGGWLDGPDMKQSFSAVYADGTSKTFPNRDQLRRP